MLTIPNRLKALCLCALIAMFVAGCGSQSTPKPSIAQTLEEQLSDYYKLARSSKSPKSEQYRLAAADILISLSRYDEAEAVLSGINSRRLPSALATQFKLSSARLALALARPQEALRLLSTKDIRVAAADRETKSAFHQLRAQAFEQLDEPLESVRELILLSPLLDEIDQSPNHESIWQALLHIDADDFRSALKNNPTGDMQGWLQLAVINQHNEYDMDRQLLALNTWLQQWPQHPAAGNLPTELALLSQLVAQQAKKVTLLLPLTGKNAVAGQAIRDGFLTAYYAANSQGRRTPELRIMDSGNTPNVLELYDQALAEGTDFIIGPLKKQHVRTLQKSPDLLVPTLALNYGDDALAPANLFQFGLSAEDEARQVADKAWKDGHRYALVLAPEGEWGARVAEAFASHWTSLSGELLEIQTFSENKVYTDAVKELLNIDASEKRAKDLRRLLRQSLDFKPRRRQDADFIFVVATSKQARQIKPTLAFHFAGSIPVYATSHIYSGSVSPLLDRDLDGIRFCETPWMLSYRNNPLRLQVRDTWPNNADRFGRLYALGIDAFYLIPRVKQLSQIANSRIQGTTGALSVEESGRIKRTLNWAAMRGGKIRRLN